MKLSDALSLLSLLCPMAVVVVSSRPCDIPAFVTPSFSTSTTSSTSSSSYFIRSSTFLQSRPDSSDAVKAAMEASEQYGPQSKEARLAWELVEEMDSSDNSAAYAGNVDQEDLEKKLALLAKLIEQQKGKIQMAKNVAEQVQNVKILDPTASSSETASKSTSPRGGGSDPAMMEALAEAKRATEEHGLNSPEARVAWEAVEEIASSDRQSEAIKGTPLDDECLVETLEACEAMEELQRVLNLQKSDSRYSG